MTLWNAEGLKPIGYLVWPLRSLKVRNPFLTLTWPGDLAFGDLGLKFLHKVSNSIASRYWKNTGGVGIFCPPPLQCACLWAEREARSEFFCEKSQYARPDPTRPNPTRPHHAFEKLISLERVDRFTSGLLCSISPFNKFRIWPTPIPAGACHGTWHVPRRGCRRLPLHR